jgi:hypothetical protein
MIKPNFLLVTLPFVASGASASDAYFMVPMLLRSAAPELLACVLVTLAALVLACLSLRRSMGLEERAQALHGQLAAERESRAQSEQALADNHDVVYRAPTSRLCTTAPRRPRRQPLPAAWPAP